MPTISNTLLWNDPGLIVITNTQPPDPNSYVVPAPGVRLKLADLADQLPTWTFITDVNNRADLVGVGGSSFYVAADTFLLEHSRPGEEIDAATPGPVLPETPVARRLDAAKKVESQRQAAARPYGPLLRARRLSAPAGR